MNRLSYLVDLAVLYVGWTRTPGESICVTLHCHEEEVNFVAVSADGQLIISASWEGSVCLWDVQTREIIGVLSEGNNFDDDVKYTSSS
eukprot:IDg23216t1